MKYKKAAIEFISVALIVLWAYAAFSKLFAFDTFRYQLGKSPLLTPFAGFLAVAVPALEILLVVMLLFPKYKKLGTLFSGILLSIFTIYLAGMLWFAEDIPCSCGGIISNFTWSQHVYFNIVYLLLAFTGVWLQNNGVKGKSENGIRNSFAH